MAYRRRYTRRRRSTRRKRLPKFARAGPTGQTRIYRPSGVLNLSRGAAHGMPNKARIKFANQTEANLGGGAIIDAASTAFQINSAYDPFGGGGVAQPPHFDCMLTSAGPYLRYRVTGCKYTIQCLNLADVPTRVAVYISDSALDMSLITAYSLVGHKLLQSFILSPKGGAADRKTFRRSYYFPKIFGRKVLTDNDYRGPYNDDPDDLFYLYIIAQSLDGGSYVNVTYSMDLIQYTQLEDCVTAANHLED